MFLHLGGDWIVPKEEVIAIVDLESSTQAETTREFLAVAKDEGFILRIAEKGKEKSFVVTSKNVYLSPISSSTLMKRGNQFKEMIKEWDER